jgi:hypothetical protein
MATKKIKKKSPKSTVPPVCKKTKKEINRILVSNILPIKHPSMKESIEKIIKNQNLSEADAPFIRSFYSHLLKEAEEEIADIPAEGEMKSPDDFTPDNNKEDYEKSFEPETEQKDFDVEGLDPNISTESIKKIKDWSGKLDQFAEFLNDPSTESLHKILADNDKSGSLLRGITRKASDSITRIAGEIEKLKEVLNSFIIMAPKKLRDSENLKSN